MAESSRTVVVHFAPGSASLSPDARAHLREALSDLLPARRITIIGRTDSTGDLTLNETLALARAAKVRDYLSKAQADLNTTLTLQTQGACCFIAPNDTASGRAKNRRVEVVFHTNEADRT